jgi:hypothetical protein
MYKIIFDLGALNWREEKSAGDKAGKSISENTWHEK